MATFYEVISKKGKKVWYFKFCEWDGRVNSITMFPDLDGLCEHLVSRYAWAEDEFQAMRRK